MGSKTCLCVMGDVIEEDFIDEMDEFVDIANQ
jgi:hypothetical protein